MAMFERSCKKSYHKRHDSDELDVFEAAGYFSGSNQVCGEEKMSRSRGRISLDIPMMSSTRSSTIQPQTHQYNQMEKPTTKEKKYKQPNSPGGRLASFLNSLFSQNSSKKKKSKSLKDEDLESPCGRRKRRSSISHFRTNISSSSSEFKAPTYTKNTYKDFKPAVLLNVKPADRNNARLDDDKFEFNTTITTTTTTTTNKNGFSSEKCKIFGNGFINQSSERDFRNFINEMDDGADSDSSSDLFELQNYDLSGCYSSGLPVYETTHMDSIKRGAPTLV